MNSKSQRVLRLAAFAGATAMAFGWGVVQAADTAPDAVYVAHLSALNTGLTGGATTGEARFEIHDNKLTIRMKINGAPPGIVHWQHFHGFEDGHAAACATPADDANGDGIVDLIETEKVSGTTMVPFDNAPAAMDVAHGTYPQAATDGSYTYTQTTSLKDLSTAFAKAFGGSQLSLDHRVVYVHGVPGNTKLASSVASLGPIPASVTVPIACGRIERIK